VAFISAKEAKLLSNKGSVPGTVCAVVQVGVPVPVSALASQVIGATVPNFVRKIIVHK
jgi:hypothetical protein